MSNNNRSSVLYNYNECRFCDAPFDDYIEKIHCRECGKSIFSVAMGKKVTFVAHSACLEEKPEVEKKVTQTKLVYSEKETRDFILRWKQRVTRGYENWSLE